MRKFLRKSDFIGDDKLRAAVVRQSGGWRCFTENAPDIARHGIGGGFHGWIYTRDTELFAKRYLVEILEAMEECGDEITPGSGRQADANWFAWWACEFVTQAYMSEIE